jgi:hypothetical protein
LADALGYQFHGGHVTARPSLAYGDPLEYLMRSCHGCLHEERISIAGSVRMICALDKKHGKRCGAHLEKRPMTLDESNQIEELLTAWYDWQRGYFPQLGAGRVDPTCRGFAESDRHSTIDERTEAAERKAQKKRAEQVDLCVDALTWQQRAAIQTHMRNKAVGVQVWRNARFDIEQTHVLYQEAKFALLPALCRRGLLARKDAA